MAVDDEAGLAAGLAAVVVVVAGLVVVVVAGLVVVVVAGLVVVAALVVVVTGLADETTAGLADETTAGLAAGTTLSLIPPNPPSLKSSYTPKTGSPLHALSSLQSTTPSLFQSNAAPPQPKVSHGPSTVLHSVSA